MAHDYDLIVIGAGSGGVRAARVAGNYGAKVAIIEEYRIGGTCVIRGCVPKKLFVYASRFSDMFEIAGSFGWTITAEFDWPTLVRNKDKEIDRLEKAYVSGLEGARVEIIRDRAVLTGPNSVKLKSGRELSAKYILVATGRTFLARSLVSPRTRRSTSKSSPTRSSSKAAATSRSNSQRSSQDLASTPQSSTGAARSCAASTTICAPASKPACRNAA